MIKRIPVKKGKKSEYNPREIILEWRRLAEQLRGGEDSERLQRLADQLEKITGETDEYFT